MTEFNTNELASILTHIFIIPALIISWKHAEYFGTTFFFLVLGTFNSCLLHVCFFAGDESLCVYSRETLQLMDHTTAELMILVVAVNFLKVKDLYVKDLILNFTTWVLVYCKIALDDVWFVLGLGLLFLPIIVWRNRDLPKRQPKTLTFTLYFAAIGLALYYVDFAYSITHPFWHVFSMLSGSLAIYMLMVDYLSGHGGTGEPNLFKGLRDAPKRTKFFVRM